MNTNHQTFSEQEEYAKEVMLICPPNGPSECMPYPSVSHQRNKYKIVVKNGIKYAKQLFLSEKDFRKTPSVVLPGI